MTEKLIFEMSGLVKNQTDISEIEFWGHDAGEYILKEIDELLKELEDQTPLS